MIRNRLKELLEESIMTQAELALKTGVSKATISNIINERVLPSLEVAFDIANVLQTPIDKIFYRSTDGNLYIDYSDCIDKMKVLYEYYSLGILTRETLEMSIDDIYNSFIKKYNKEDFKKMLKYTEKFHREIHDIIYEILEKRII